MGIRIKNWENFQHYRDRNPPWIKLHRRLLNDREFFNLDGDCVKTLVLLWMLAAETTGGELPAIEDIAFRLRLDSKVLACQITKLNHWLIADASDMLADCLQDESKVVQSAPSETERETENRERDRVEIPARMRDPKPKRKTILSPDWHPNEAHANLSRDLGIDLLVQVSAFRDYEAAHRRVMADWDACFRTWLRKSAEFGRGLGPKGRKLLPQEQSQLAIQEWLKEAEEAEQNGQQNDSGNFTDDFGILSRKMAADKTDIASVVSDAKGHRPEIRSTGRS